MLCKKSIGTELIEVNTESSYKKWNIAAASSRDLMGYYLFCLRLVEKYNHGFYFFAVE